MTEAQYEDDHPFLGVPPNRAAASDAGVDWATWDLYWGIAERRIDNQYCNMMQRGSATRSMAKAIARDASDHITELTLSLLARRDPTKDAPRWAMEDWHVDALSHGIFAVEPDNPRPMTRTVVSGSNASPEDRSLIASAPKMADLLVQIADDERTEGTTRNEIHALLGPLRPDLFKPLGVLGAKDPVYVRARGRHPATPFDVRRLDPRLFAEAVTGKFASDYKSDRVFRSPPGTFTPLSPVTKATVRAAPKPDPVVAGIYFWGSDDVGSGA